MRSDIRELVYVIAQEGVKFGINFTSCSENGNEFARGTAEMLFCRHRYNEWNLSQNSLLPVLSQINTIALSLKSKYLIFKLASTMSSGFFCSQRVTTAAG